MNKTLSRFGVLFLFLLFYFQCSSQTILNIENKKAGKLSKVLKKKMTSSVSLKIDGFLNADDVIYLRSCPNLKNLDLTDAVKQDLTAKRNSVLSGIAGKFIGVNLVNQKSSNEFRTDEFNIGEHYFTKDTYPGAFMNYIYGEMDRKKLDTLTISSDLDLQNPIVAYFDPCFIKIKSSNRLILNKCPSQLHNLYGVTEIFVGAFANNKSIDEVTIPSSVSIIPDFCFYGCTSLSSVKIEGTVTSIGKNAFANTSVRNITLPASVRKIWFNSFDKCNMKLLASVPPQIQLGETVSYKDTNDKLKNWNVEIPSGSFKEYHENDMWNKAVIKEKGAMNKYVIYMEKPGTIMSKIPMSVWSSIDTLIINGSLYDTDMAIIRKMVSLKYVDIQNTVISESPETKAERKRHKESLNAAAKLIGISADMAYNDGDISTPAYMMAKSISDISETESSVSGVKESAKYSMIPSESFIGLKKLKIVKLPQGTVYIGDEAFKGCISLSTVDIPKSTKIIGMETFSGCENLKIEKFPQNISTLKTGAFRNCTSLNEIDLSRTNLKGRFDLSIFYGCNLHMLKLPYGIETIIGDLKGCIVFIPNNVKQMQTTFENCELHFASKNPPQIRFFDTVYIGYKNTIYVPKNCTTAYYNTFGDGNSYIEK